MKVGIIGSGAMGSGIAQLIAQAGDEVILFDAQAAALDKAQKSIETTLSKLSDKGKITKIDAKEIGERIAYATSLSDFGLCDWVIEAIIENLEAKKTVFAEVEKYVSATTVLATNTSSLSVTAIAAACEYPQRVVGVHFFNPAPLMPLVEIIPALQTAKGMIEKARSTISSWKKIPVTAKDTPGFIVNRVARPFYGEALRIYEEGIADMATIDAAMRDSGFRMGPFELMDLIGNDINYAVTESVFAAFYFDPRYKPSITQCRMTEAGWYGRKSGRGYYDYSDGSPLPKPSSNEVLRHEISARILCMLINEAYDALYLNIATAEDLDLAMTKGVNYPKGLIEWGQEIGLHKVAEVLDSLNRKYHEDRYRCSPGIKG